MLIRLIYVSKAVNPQTHTLADSILRQAHAWNRQNDITGVLCEGQGVFLQALEGERGKVTRLYARIFVDPRHQDLELIHCESITERRYGEPRNGSWTRLSGPRCGGLARRDDAAGSCPRGGATRPARRSVAQSGA